jgi:hypothetical protein
VPGQQRLGQQGCPTATLVPAGRQAGVAVGGY